MKPKPIIILPSWHAGDGTAERLAEEGYLVLYESKPGEIRLLTATESLLVQFLHYLRAKFARPAKSPTHQPKPTPC